MEIPFCFLGKSDEEIRQLFEEEDRIIAEERAKAREIQLQKDKEEQRELQELDRLQKKYHG
jgi:vacuolar-type H+-ATPase subunit H